MQEFIVRENIKRFRAMLERASDEREKVTLRKLLADEERRLADSPGDE